VVFGLVGLFAGSYLWSAIFFVLRKWPVDLARPWSVSVLVLKHGWFEPQALSNSLMASMLIGASVVVIVLVAKPNQVHGDARWANRMEIQSAEMLASKGVILGKLGASYLQNDEPVHVLVAAPTRSGKGVGVVIPNLLSWSGSVVVLDIKHENFTVTSGFRAEHQPVFLWSPMDDKGKSHRFNPLDLVRAEIGHRVGDLQRMGKILVPDGGSDPMWANEARDLFLAVALWVLDDTEGPSTFGEMYRLLKGDADLGEVAEYVIENYAESLDPAARRSLANFSQKAPKERSGVKSNLTAAMALWANPTIDAATSASDFDPRELRRRPTSIYVGVKQNQLQTLEPLLALFFQLVVDSLGGELPGDDEPHSVLMMLDEFASLGRMDTLAGGLAFLAGYNIRIVIIVQGIGQLDTIYGKGRENFLQNSAVQVFFAPNDDTTTHYISNRLGTKTIVTTSKSSSEGHGFIGRVSRTRSSSGRPFMLPEEVRRLAAAKLIAFKEGARPILGQKIRYFASRDFKSRLRPAVSVPTLAIGHPPERGVVLPVSPVSSALTEATLEPVPEMETAGSSSLSDTKVEMGARLSQLVDDSRETST